MRHQRVSSVVQPPPEKQETSKSLSRGPLLRVNFRHGLVLVCLFLLAVSLLGIILRHVFSSRGLAFVIRETMDQSNSNNPDELVGSQPTQPAGLEFMEAKNVVLVSHELSLSGGPLLLMELAVLLRKNGVHVFWVTANQKETVTDLVVHSLEDKLVSKEVQILPARGTKTIRAVSSADLVILNTAVAGKWIGAALKSDTKKVFSKILWWIHEMRGHYFALEYVKYLPDVAGVMIDSQATADFWQLRTKERLRMSMPRTYVVHLGNSQELMVAAEDPVARRLMGQHVRQNFGFHDNDVVFAMINSISRGKGQDLFLRAFLETVKSVRIFNVMQPTVREMRALIVGSDWAVPKYEIMLRNFVKENDMDRLVQFVNKSMNVIPYLAATDVLVQNSQGRGECFGRITIEAMAFRLPVLGTAAGGTLEIVVNGSTGRLHPVGKDGVGILAQNIRDLALHKSLRVRMGHSGYKRVKDHFMEHHMCERLGHVFKDILSRNP